MVNLSAAQKVELKGELLHLQRHSVITDDQRTQIMEAVPALRRQRRKQSTNAVPRHQANRKKKLDCTV